MEEQPGGKLLRQEYRIRLIGLILNSNLPRCRLDMYLVYF